jgi:hypothetical protein
MIMKWTGSMDKVAASIRTLVEARLIKMKVKPSRVVKHVSTMIQTRVKSFSNFQHRRWTAFNGLLRLHVRAHKGRLIVWCSRSAPYSSPLLTRCQWYVSLETSSFQKPSNSFRLLCMQYIAFVFTMNTLSSCEAKWRMYPVSAPTSHSGICIC